MRGAEVAGQSIWDRAHELAADQPSLSVLLENLTLERCEGGIAVVVAARPGQSAYLRARGAALEDLLSRAAGRPLRLDVREPEPSSGAETPLPQGAGVDSEAYAQALKHPLVRRAAELLGARLIAVERDSPKAPAPDAAAAPSEPGVPHDPGRAREPEDA